MGADRHHDWRDEAASTLEWWRDAGVDTFVDELPRDWLAPETAAPMRVTDVSPSHGSAFPKTLEAFLAWRSGADVPEAAWSGVSIAASGPADAAIMVLVDCPDRDDGSVGALLAGAPGRLFEGMLGAIGLTRDAIHLAAVCAKRPSAGRLGRAVDERLSMISRHHVGLVTPKRLLLLGNAACRAILGAEMAQARGSAHVFNHEAGTTSVVASFHPRFLIEKPAAKAEAWKDLQLLMAGLDR